MMIDTMLYTVRLPVLGAAPRSIYTYSNIADPTPAPISRKQSVHVVHTGLQGDTICSMYHPLFLDPNILDPIKFKWCTCAGALANEINDVYKRVKNCLKLYQKEKYHK